MAEDINIKINVDSSDLGKAQKGIDDFGKKAEGATEHTGHLRKELRALGEAGKIGGEAMGQAGKEAGAIGEGARIAYAGLELMNGGLKNIAMTLATNPIFLLGAAIAAIAVSMIDMNKEIEKTTIEVIKNGEKIREFEETTKEAMMKAAQAADDLAFANGQLTKSEYDKRKAQREGAKEADALVKKEAKGLGELRLAQEDAAKEYYKVKNEIFTTPGMVAKAYENAKKATEQLEAAQKEMGKTFKAAAKATSDNVKTEEVKNKKESAKKYEEEKKRILKEAKELLELKLKNKLELDQAISSADKDNLSKKKQVLDDEMTIELSNEKLTGDERENIKKAYALKYSVIEADYNKKREEEDIKTAEFMRKLMEETAKKQQEAHLLELKTKLEVDKEKANADKFNLTLKIQVMEDEMAIELANTKLTEQEKADIKEKYRQMEHDAKVKSFEDDLQLAENLTSSLQNLSDAVFSYQTRNLKQGSAEQLAAAKKQFKINKALGITNAVINGAGAVVKSIETLGPPVYPNIMGIIGMVTVAATNIAQIAKIASTQFNEGGTASATSGGATQSRSGGDFTPQSLQKIGGGQSGFNNPNMPQGQSGKTGQQPSKVYVVANDISTSQNKQAVLERRASFNK